MKARKKIDFYCI
jgi:hypothetical protein